MRGTFRTIERVWEVLREAPLGKHSKLCDENKRGFGRDNGIDRDMVTVERS